MMDPCDSKHVGAILNIFKYFIIILIVSTNYIFVHLLDNKVFYCNCVSSCVTTQGDFCGTFLEEEEVSYEAGITVCGKNYRSDLTHEKFYESRFLGRNLLSGPPEH